MLNVAGYISNGILGKVTKEIQEIKRADESSSAFPLDVDDERRGPSYRVVAGSL